MLVMDKVLLVDDDYKVLRILWDRLQKYKDKFEVLLAYNGEEAMEVLQQNSISVVITDIVMPKMDGLELLAHVNESYPDVTCFVMTAHETAEIREKLSENMVPIFSKPFLIDDLAKAVIQTLEQDAQGGTLKGISVANFLQLIQMEEKTCFLEIRTTESEKGHFYLKKGELYDAVFNDLKGEEAAFKLLALDNVSIRFKNISDEKIHKRINISLMNLLMESQRLKDESKKSATTSRAGGMK